MEPRQGDILFMPGVPLDSSSEEEDSHSSSSGEDVEELPPRELARSGAGFGRKRPAERAGEDFAEGEEQRPSLAELLGHLTREAQLKLCSGYCSYLRAEVALTKKTKK